MVAGVLVWTYYVRRQADNELCEHESVIAFLTPFMSLVLILAGVPYTIMRYQREAEEQ